MNFIKEIIGADERLMLVARLHWIYIVTGMIWCAMFSGAGFYIDSQLWKWFGQHIPDYEQEIWLLRFGADYHLIFWLFTAAGAMFLIMHTLKVLATVIALTTRRLIYKTGWIFVAFEEVEIDDIRAEHVHHGFFGRFLGYGTMKIDCRFVGDISLPAVKKPYRLIKAIHVARARLPQLGHTHDDSHTNPSPKENHQRNHNGEKSDDEFSS